MPRYSPTRTNHGSLTSRTTTPVQSAARTASHGAIAPFSASSPWASAEKTRTVAGPSNGSRQKKPPYPAPARPRLPGLCSRTACAAVSSLAQSRHHASSKP